MARNRNQQKRGTGPGNPSGGDRGRGRKGGGGGAGARRGGDPRTARSGVPEAVVHFMQCLPPEIQQQVPRQAVQRLWDAYQRVGDAVFSDPTFDPISHVLGEENRKKLRQLIETQGRASHGDGTRGADKGTGKGKGKGGEPRTLKIFPGLEIDLGQTKRALAQFGVHIGGDEALEPTTDLESGSTVPDLTFTSTVKGDRVEYRSVSDDGDIEFVLVYPATLSKDALSAKHKVMIINDGRAEQRVGADKQKKEVTVYAVILADTNEQVQEFKQRIDDAERAVAQEPTYHKGEVVQLEVDLPVAGAQQEFITTAPDGRVIVIHNPLLFHFDEGKALMEVRITRGARKGVDAQYEAEIVMEKAIAIEWARLDNSVSKWKHVFDVIHNRDILTKVRGAIANGEVQNQFDDDCVMADGLHAAVETLIHGIMDVVAGAQTPSGRRKSAQRQAHGSMVEQVKKLKEQAVTAVQTYDSHMRKVSAYVEPYLAQPDEDRGIDTAIDSMGEYIDLRDEYYHAMREIDAVVDPGARLNVIQREIATMTDAAERERLEQRMKGLKRQIMALAFAAAEVGSYDAALETRGGELYETFMRMLRQAGFVVGIDPVIQANGERHSFGPDSNISITKGDRLTNFRVEMSRTRTGETLMVYFDIDGEAHNTALEQFQQLLQRGTATAEDVRNALDAVYDSGIQHCSVDEFVQLLRSKILTVEHASAQHERLLERLAKAPMQEFIHLLNAYREEVDLSGRREFIVDEEEGFIAQVNELTIQRLRRHLQLPEVAHITMSSLESRNTGMLAIDITVPDVFVERAVVVTGRETPEVTNALAQRVAVAMEKYAQRVVEGGVALREGLKGRVDDAKKLSDILVGVPVALSVKELSVIRNTLDPNSFALSIDGTFVGVDAEVFRRLQLEGAITVTEGPIQYPEGAQESIEQCNERFSEFVPPLRLGEVFVFDYTGTKPLADAGMVHGMRLILRGYEPGDGTAGDPPRLSFYYADAVDGRGEVNAEYSVTHSGRPWKIGAVMSNYSVAEILNALKNEPPAPRLIRIQTREGVHRELAANKPRKVRSMDVMTALQLPQETIEGRKVNRFVWNGDPGRIGERVVIATGDVCRVVRWDDDKQEVELAIEANGLIVKDNITISYRMLEHTAATFTPAPTVVESEGELNRLYYRLLALQEKKIITISGKDRSIMNFLHDAYDGRMSYIDVHRVVTVPVLNRDGTPQVKDGQPVTRQRPATKTLHVDGWNDKEVRFSFTHETVRRTYSIPDFMAALEDPTNMLGSTNEQTHAYAPDGVPEQNPTVVARPGYAEVSDGSGIDDEAADVPTADALDSTMDDVELPEPIGYDTPEQRFQAESKEFLRTLKDTYNISEDTLRGELVYNGTPVIVEVLSFLDDRKYFNGEVLITTRRNFSVVIPRQRRLRRRRTAFTMAEFIDLVEQKQIQMQSVPRQERLPGEGEELGEKKRQFMSALKVIGISSTQFKDGLRYKGKPVRIELVPEDSHSTLGAVALMYRDTLTRGKPKYVAFANPRRPFKRSQRLSYEHFIRLIHSGDITAAPQPSDLETQGQFIERKSAFISTLFDMYGITEGELNSGKMEVNGVEAYIEIASSSDEGRTHDLYFSPVNSSEQLTLYGQPFEGESFEACLGDIAQELITRTGVSYGNNERDFFPPTPRRFEPEPDISTLPEVTSGDYAPVSSGTPLSVTPPEGVPPVASDDAELLSDLPTEWDLAPVAGLTTGEHTPMSGEYTPAHGVTPVSVTPVEGVPPVAPRPPERDTRELERRFRNTLQEKFGLTRGHLSHWNMLYRGKPISIYRAYSDEPGEDLVFEDEATHLMPLAHRGALLYLSFDECLRLLDSGEITRKLDGNFETAEKFEERRKAFEEFLRKTYGWPNQWLRTVLYNGHEVDAYSTSEGTPYDIELSLKDYNVTLRHRSSRLELSFDEFLELVKSGELTWKPKP